MPIEGTSRHVSALFIQRHWFFDEANKNRHRRTKNIEYLNLRLFIIQERLKRIMAKSKSTSDTSGNKPQWQGYKNINIPASHIAECENYLADTKNVWQDFLTLLNKGYTVKQYLDTKDMSYKCTLHCVNSDEPNAGYAMSAFGGDWYSALGCVLYKHFVLADEDWSSVDIGEKRSFG